MVDTNKRVETVCLNVCVSVSSAPQKYDMPCYKQNFMIKKLKKVKLVFPNSPILDSG